MKKAMTMTTRWFARDDVEKKALAGETLLDWLRFTFLEGPSPVKKEIENNNVEGRNMFGATGQPTTYKRDRVERWMVEAGVPQIPKGALMRAGTFIYELEEIRKLGSIIPKAEGTLPLMFRDGFTFGDEYATGVRVTSTLPNECEPCVFEVNENTEGVRVYEATGWKIKTQDPDKTIVRDYRSNLSPSAGGVTRDGTNMVTLYATVLWKLSENQPPTPKQLQRAAEMGEPAPTSRMSPGFQMYNEPWDPRGHDQAGWVMPMPKLFIEREEAFTIDLPFFLTEYTVEQSQAMSVTCDCYE